MFDPSRRGFLVKAPAALLASATGLHGSELFAQSPYPRLTKETWVLQQTPESRQRIAEYEGKHPILGRGVAAILNAHPLVHEYFRFGDICIQGFGTDRFSGKRLEFDRAEEGMIQVFAMSWTESEADRNRHGHPTLAPRPVRLNGSLAKMGEAELLGVLLDAAAAINKLQSPYSYVTTNSNKVYVTLAAWLGLCSPANGYSEVEEVKPYALIGADVPFQIKPETNYQNLAQRGKSVMDIKKAFNNDHMAMFPNASADLRSIGPRNSRDRPAELAV